MKGLRMVIGDGEDSLVWRDNWIEDVRPRAPFGFGIGQNLGLKVRDLIDLISSELCRVCLHSFFVWLKILNTF